MPQELAACKIPSEWLQKIDVMAREAGVNRSDILKQAIAQFIGESSQPTQNEALTSLTERIDRLESLVSELLETPSKQGFTPVNAAKSVESHLDANQSDSDKRTNASIMPLTPVIRHSQGTNSPPCPKCSSDRTRFEGKGKLRRDGTRSQRIMCLDCKQTSSFG
ncbi:CopG family transcriptional regulator [Cyanobacteria bacterium FACHB-63]|nr:CopG family transcriptional regulator [Cyanobacteria bacterium FACHB-63]